MQLGDSHVRLEPQITPHRPPLYLTVLKFLLSFSKSSPLTGIRQLHMEHRTQRRNPRPLLMSADGEEERINLVIRVDYRW